METAYVQCEPGTCGECDELLAEYEAQGMTVKVSNEKTRAAYAKQDAKIEAWDLLNEVERLCAGKWDTLPRKMHADTALAWSFYRKAEYPSALDIIRGPYGIACRMFEP